MSSAVARNGAATHSSTRSTRGSKSCGGTSRPPLRPSCARRQSFCLDLRAIKYYHPSRIERECGLLRQKFTRRVYMLLALAQARRKPDCTTRTTTHEIADGDASDVGDSRRG